LLSKVYIGAGDNDNELLLALGESVDGIEGGEGLASACSQLENPPASSIEPVLDGLFLIATEGAALTEAQWRSPTLIHRRILTNDRGIWLDGRDLGLWLRL
jgi:hypothetical protein